MTTPHISVEGIRALAAHVCVPLVGCWIADVDFDDRVELSGVVTLVVAGTELVGKVDPSSSGSYLQHTRMRIVGGLGWSSIVPAREYHSDAGVKASTIATNLATEVGETIEGAGDGRVGIYFERRPVRAARVLDRIYPSWWVRFDGVTDVRPREQSELGTGVEILSVNPREGVVQLSVDNLGGVAIGTVLRGRLDQPLTVRSVDFRAADDKLRAVAWGVAA